MCGAISELEVIYVETRDEHYDTELYLEFLRMVKCTIDNTDELRDKNYLYFHDNVSFHRTAEV